MAENSFKIFGFEISRSKGEKRKDPTKIPSITTTLDDDGSGYIVASGGHTGHYYDLDGDKAKDNSDLIGKYRSMAQYSEVDNAIEDIVNEAIALDDKNEIVELSLDNVAEISDGVKDQMQTEFNNVLGLLQFNNYAHDIFRRWYVDGRIVYNIVIDEKIPKAGIKDIRPVDSMKIRKVKEAEMVKDPRTGVELIQSTKEYYLFSEEPNLGARTGAPMSNAVKLSTDSVVYITSGLVDSTNQLVVSYLQKALKPVNQLRMMEDSLVIYRLARAPERRIFYIDVGNMAPGRAEQYVKDIMSRYRNKLVYDATTGDIRDDRKHMSMMEDFWLPRREGSKGTEISSLPGGQNLDQIEDILYFKKRLYESLNVPLSRLESDTQNNIGRTSEVTRDELKFQKYIDRLRRRFSKLFLDLLKTQLLLKGIITQSDWDKWQSDISVSFAKDNYFAELKDAEILQERINTLDTMRDYIGQYVSKEYVMKTVLKMNEEEIEEMKKQIESESNENTSLTSLQDAEILSQRLDTLGSLEEYIGKYVSKDWVYKNVLLMDDKEVLAMQQKLADEKAADEAAGINNEEEDDF